MKEYFNKYMWIVEDQFMRGMEKDFLDKKFKLISFNPFNED